MEPTEHERYKQTIRPFWELMSPAQKAEYLARDRPVKRLMSELALYRTDAVLVRSYTPVCAGMVTSPAKIGSIPSRRSIANLIFLLNNSDVPMRTMLTFTMTPEVSDGCSVAQHRKVFRTNALQHLRDKHGGAFVWVREFQDSGSLHWHIFAEFECNPSDWPDGSPDRSVDLELTRHWSRWFCKQYKRILPDAEFGFMREGNGSDFHGCVRVEKLRTSAAGRYAGKEGGKRLQKMPPDKWVADGGAWWRNSKGLVCSEHRRVTVPVSEIDAAKVVVDGKVLEVPYRVQFNVGAKRADRS